MSPAATTWWRAAGAGLAATAVGAGLGELVAGIFLPTSSPIATVGSAAIDGAPAWAKDTAIALFGTGDKIALVVGIAIVLLAVGAGLGVLERWRSPLGRLAAVLLGIVGVVAAMTRADAGLLSWIPAALAGVGAAVALGILIPRVVPPASVIPAASPALVPANRVPKDVAMGAPERQNSGHETRKVGHDGGGDGAEGTMQDATTPSRRTFLAWTGGAAALGVIAAAAGTVMRVTAEAARTVREAITLPSPTTTAAPVPAGASLDVTGISPIVTPTADFYRIDTALVVPQVTASEWSLRIHGMVAREVTLTWDELLALPMSESYTTLMCVSNQVGGDLIGNAKWLGYPIRELLARAEPDADADMVLSTSVDGFTASSPLEALTDERNSILAVGMNDEPLPAEHGYPVRMVVPGLYGYVSATKWVVDLEVTRFDQGAAYWTARGWSPRGPIKLESRIDVPAHNDVLTAGDQVIAGVAWQQHVGVSAVEVRVDDGDWQQAELAAAISDDTWVQWRLPWTADAGDHTIRVRATNAEGEVQTTAVASPAPNGATGLHTIQVNVT